MMEHHLKNPIDQVAQPKSKAWTRPRIGGTSYTAHGVRMNTETLARKFCQETSIKKTGAIPNDHSKR